MLKGILSVVALLLVLTASAQAQTPRVLVFHPDPAGNPEVAAGVSAITSLGRQGGFQVTATRNAPCPRRVMWRP